MPLIYGMTTWTIHGLIQTIGQGLGSKSSLGAARDNSCPGTTKATNSESKYCWEFNGYPAPSGTIYTQRTISTAQYSSVGLTYSMRPRNGLQNTQECFVCYIVNGGACQNIMVQNAANQGTITARQYTSWTDAAGQDSLAIRIGKTGDGTTFYCMFDEFRLWGNLATPAPTAKPTDVTTSPTRSTGAPSNIPTISTNNPTATPSNNPSASSNDPTATPSQNPREHLRSSLTLSMLLEHLEQKRYTQSIHAQMTSLSAQNAQTI
eukprot:885890_1